MNRIPLKYMRPAPVKPRMRTKDAARHARLGLLQADQDWRNGDIDARTSREDFRAALNALERKKP